MHDISKLNSIHQKTYIEWQSQPLLNGAAVPEELYQLWLTLSEIPQKDWGKPSTQEAIEARVVDENTK